MCRSARCMSAATVALRRLSPLSALRKRRSPRVRCKSSFRSGEGPVVPGRSGQRTCQRPSQLRLLCRPWSLSQRSGVLPSRPGAASSQSSVRPLSWPCVLSTPWLMLNCCQLIRVLAAGVVAGVAGAGWAVRARACTLIWPGVSCQLPLAQLRVVACWLLSRSDWVAAVLCSRTDRASTTSCPLCADSGPVCVRACTRALSWLWLSWLSATSWALCRLPARVRWVAVARRGG